MKRWIRKIDIMKIRHAENGEMVDPGQFSEPGDMIIIDNWRNLENDILITKEEFEKEYLEVEVPDKN